MVEYETDKTVSDGGEKDPDSYRKNTIEELAEKKGREPSGSPRDPRVDVIHEVRESDGICDKIRSFSEPIEAFADPKHIDVLGTGEIPSSRDNADVIDAIRSKVDNIGKGNLIGAHMTELHNAKDIESTGDIESDAVDRDGVRDGKFFFWLEPEHSISHLDGFVVVEVPADETYVSHYAVANTIGNMISEKEYEKDHVVTGREYIECYEKGVLPWWNREGNEMFGYSLD